MSKLSIGSFKPRAPRELVCYPNVLAPRHIPDLCEKAHFLTAWCALSSKHMNMLARVCGLVYASINVKPEVGEPPGICGAFDFSEEFLVKIPTLGPQNLVKLDQISTTFQRLIFRRKASWYYQQSIQSPQRKVFHQFILKMSNEK